MGQISLQIFRADGSGFCANQHRAFKLSQKGTLVDGKKAAAAGYRMQPKKSGFDYSASRPLPANEQIRRLESALPWLDAENTSTWHKLMMAFKGVASIIGYDNALELAIRYSRQASVEAQKNNDKPCYDPATFFQNAQPSTITDPIRVLLANARDNALSCLSQGISTAKTLTEEQVQAATYCATYHREAYFQLVSGIGK